MAVQRGGVGLILPQDSQHLAVGTGGAVAVHKVGQQLLAFAALEGERTSAHKDLEVAEALDLDAHRCRFRRVAQIFQHIAHVRLVGGLEQKTADEDLQCFQCILRVLGDHDDIAAGLQFLDHAGKGKAIHARHFQVQKGSIHWALPHPRQGIVSRHGTDIVTVRCHPAQDADQRIDRKLTVIHNQYFHSFIPLSAYAKQFPAVSLARCKLLGKFFSGKAQKRNVFAQISVHLLLSLQVISAASVAFFDEIPEHCALN